MPYLRGSSSIGRIVFSGIHLKIFGKKLIIPEEADQIAMLTNFEEFRGFMIKHMITN